MTHWRKRLATAMAAGLTALLTACSSAPVEQFHTLRAAPELATPPTATSAATPTPAPRWRLAIAPVGLPALLDRPQWVLRAPDQRLRVYEQQRWAQPLATEIAETLADAINAIVATQADPGLAFVRQVGADPALDAALQLQFQVLKMDSFGGPSPAIDDQFEWMLRCRADQDDAPAAPSTIHHHSTGKQAVGGMDKGDTATLSEAMFDQLAQAHGVALRAAASAIAQQAQAMHCGAP